MAYLVIAFRRETVHVHTPGCEGLHCLPEAPRPLAVRVEVGRVGPDGRDPEDERRLTIPHRGVILRESTDGTAHGIEQRRGKRRGDLFEVMEENIDASVVDRV